MKVNQHHVNEIQTDIGLYVITCIEWNRYTTSKTNPFFNSVKCSLFPQRLVSGTLKPSEIITDSPSTRRLHFAYLNVVHHKHQDTIPFTH